MSCPPVSSRGASPPAISLRTLGVERDNDRPIGSDDDLCGAYELLGDHEVCWLEWRRKL